jgi:hypothetical protein
MQVFAREGIVTTGDCARRVEQALTHEPSCAGARERFPADDG